MRYERTPVPEGYLTPYCEGVSLDLLQFYSDLEAALVELHLCNAQHNADKRHIKEAM